jgi:hypothetical protein
MGMQQTVRFDGELPNWQAVGAALEAAGHSPPGMRMIDGEIALPDEQPPADWGELRLAAADGSGMITVQRAGQAVTLIVWGNAEAALQQAWHGLTFAFAQAGGGEVQVDGQSLDAQRFAQLKQLPIT